MGMGGEGGVKTLCQQRCFKILQPTVHDHLCFSWLQNNIKRILLDSKFTFSFYILEQYTQCAQWSRVCFERTQCVSGNICRPNTTCFFFLQRWNANIWAEKVEMKVDGDGRSNIQTEQHKQRTEGWLWLRFTFAPRHWARYCLFVSQIWFRCLFRE